MCPKNLEVYLKEREIANLQDLAKPADRYLTAHQRKLCKVSNAPIHQQPNTTNYDTGATSIEERALKQGKPLSRCYVVTARSQGSRLQILGKRQCFKCQKRKHEAKDFWSPVGTLSWESCQKTTYQAEAAKDHKDGLESENRNSTGRLPNDAGTKTSGCLLRTLASTKHEFLVLADGNEVQYRTYRI